MYEPVFDKNGNVIGYYIPSSGLVLGVNGGIIACDCPYPPFFNEDKHRH